LQLLITCGAVMLTRGRVGVAGAETRTTVWATERQVLQSTAEVDVQAALIRLALTVTLLPTPTIIAPTED
jgi:hypothetical protein